MRLTSFSIREMRIPVGVLVKIGERKGFGDGCKVFSDVGDDSQTTKFIR